MPIIPDYMSPQHENRLPAGMAITALVCGILSVVTILSVGPPLYLSTMAIAFGFTARKDAINGLARGYRMATAGLVCGVVVLALLLLWLIRALCG